jgi:aspartate/methionine/tyrosine aminotransferase
MIICAPVISQKAVEAAVREDWDHAARRHEELRLRRLALAEGLAAIPGVSWTPQPAGFFAFARIDGCTDSERLSHDLLEEAHVVTIPGSAFGPSGEGHLRLSYGFATPEDITEATVRLGQCLEAR